MTGPPPGPLGNIEDARQALLHTHPDNGQTVKTALRAVSAVLTDMVAAEWYHHEIEALYAHLRADWWRLVGFTLQEWLSPDQIASVRKPTVNRIEDWRTLVLKAYDTGLIPKPER